MCLVFLRDSVKASDQRGNKGAQPVLKGLVGHWEDLTFHPEIQSDHRVIQLKLTLLN